MASYDDVQVCELAGIYLLSRLANIIDNHNSGLYGDDVLIFLHNMNGEKTNHVRKNVMKIFKEVGFKIEIKTRVKIVNFSDVTLNGGNSTYRL